MKSETCTLSVSGTHCRSCELLIEKEISRLPGIKSVSASSITGTVDITYSGKPPQISHLNRLFQDSGYIFSLNSSAKSLQHPNFAKPIVITALILLVFYLLNRSGLFTFASVTPDTLPPAFFLFGLLAGFSTCGALVGGIVLGLARRSPGSVLTFNLGRVVIFTLLGALLGYFGSFFRLSLSASAIVTVLVSFIMIILSFQMLGISYFDRFTLALPKSITSRLSDEKHFSRGFLPFLMGGLTFLLPCGFTLTAQSLALGSSSPLTGALIMMFFSIGTFVPLALIGFTGSRAQKNPRTSAIFSQVAGSLILLFSLFNLNSQFKVLNLPAIDFTPPTTAKAAETVLKMDASYLGYSPNQFTVKANSPIRWEITDRGTSGCTNAVIAKSLFDGPVNLVPGTTSVREFTAPSKPGRYRFSCWMGMVSGTIEVVE